MIAIAFVQQADGGSASAPNVANLPARYDASIEASILQFNTLLFYFGFRKEEVTTPPPCEPLTAEQAAAAEAAQDEAGRASLPPDTPSSSSKEEAVGAHTPNRDLEQPAVSTGMF